MYNGTQCRTFVHVFVVLRFFVSFAFVTVFVVCKNFLIFRSIYTGVSYFKEVGRAAVEVTRSDGFSRFGDVVTALKLMPGAFTSLLVYSVIF